MSIQHRDIVEAQLHEAKGASTSTLGQVLTSTGGAATFQTPQPASGTISQGIYDYNDLGTSSSAISLTSANTQYEMTNDALGPFTNKDFILPGVSDLWDTSTSRFDFSGLSLGDTVDLRVDFTVTISTTNTVVDFALELGLGVSSYQVAVMSPINFKTVQTYSMVHWQGVYMGDDNTLQNPARLLARADKTGVSVVVNGWYLRPLHTNT
tara:strand:- start:4080 stop:4706 length:627 start_codon:yes stop_codon:yes gene_type:complete